MIAKLAGCEIWCVLFICTVFVLAIEFSWGSRDVRKPLASGIALNSCPTLISQEDGISGREKPS